MTPPRVPSEAELLDWFSSLSNWERFGAGDERGTLNLIDDAKRAEAARLVRDGVAVSCAWEIDPRPAADHVFGSPERSMRGTGEDLCRRKRQSGRLCAHGFDFGIHGRDRGMYRGGDFADGRGHGLTGEDVGVLSPFAMRLVLQVLDLIGAVALA